MTVSVDRNSMGSETAASAEATDISAAARPLTVVVATPFGAGGRGGMDRLTDLIVDHVNSGPPELRARRLTVRGAGGAVRGTAVFASAIGKLALEAMRNQVDLLHLNVAVGGSVWRKFLLSRIARTFGIPYLVHIHSGRFSDYWDRASTIDAQVIRTFINGAAAIIVLSESYRDMFETRLPSAMAKVHVLPNGTYARAERAARPAGAPVRIAFLGRLTPLKGTPQLIEALGMLKAEPTWTATLAGDGDITASRARIVELGLADRVTLPGWLGPADVDRVLAEADIVVLPSFTEGLPMTIIEAFGAGIPVVATHVNAVGDVVQNERNGLLIAAGDVPALATALKRLIDDPGLRDRLGRAGRQSHREKYDHEVYTAQMVDLWQRTARR